MLSHNNDKIDKIKEDMQFSVLNYLQYQKKASSLFHLDFSECRPERTGN